MNEMWHCCLVNPSCKRYTWMCPNDICVRSLTCSPEKPNSSLRILKYQKMFVIQCVPSLTSQMYLRELLRLMLPRFHQHLTRLGEDGLQLLFCHRWILLCFKREFPDTEALRMWEACWAHYQVRAKSERLLCILKFVRETLHKWEALGGFTTAPNLGGFFGRHAEMHS